MKTLTEEIKETALVQTAPAALELTTQAIEITKNNIALCATLVREVLEKDIDYGMIPGVPTPFLWDAGAAKIMSAFNCYAEYTLVRVVDLPGKLAFTVFAKLINRKSQQVVATGIGAASTREIKHRYRWVKDPEAEGISRKGLKKNEYDKYRIPNPNTEDLLNTIAKMAAKRADIDAAQSLPGVAATLRKLFHPPAGQKPKPRKWDTETGEQVPDKDTTSKATNNWKLFESKLQVLGIPHKEARDILCVNSIKNDWVGVQGKTLEEAYDVIKGAWQLTKSGQEENKEWEHLPHTSDTEPAQESLCQE